MPYCQVRFSLDGFSGDLAALLKQWVAAARDQGLSRDVIEQVEFDVRAAGMALGIDHAMNTLAHFCCTAAEPA